MYESHSPSRLSVLSLLLATALFASACTPFWSAPAESSTSTPAKPTATPVPPEPTSKRGIGDTLRLTSWEAPTSLNPHISSGIKDFVASRITYEPLASFDKAGKLVPFLAAEIPDGENGGVAEDGLSVTWHLREDVTWCDGEKFTASDVLFTYEYVTNPEVDAYAAIYYEAVERIEMVDDYTITIFFGSPNPAWFMPFVGWGGLILPRHVFEEYNGANARGAPANLQPVGTGPYCVTSFEPGEKLLLGDTLVETNKIIYEPNPYYRDPDKPYFSRIELYGGGSPELAAKRVFEEGSADYAFNLQFTTEDWDTYGKTDRAEALTKFTFYVQQLDLNHTDPISQTEDGEHSNRTIPHRFFNDRRVRQAFSYAIHRKKIAALYGKAGRPVSNILVEPETFVSPNTSYEFDLEKAAALLDEAGWIDHDGDGVRDKNGVSMIVRFQTFVSPRTQIIQQIIKEALQSLDIQVETTLIDSSVYYGGDQSSSETFERFEADMQIWENISDNPNPGPFLAQWTCAQIPQKDNNWLAGYNTARWCNPDYDTLYKKSITELDSEERRKLFIKMNDMLINDVAIIPLVHIAVVSGSSLSLEGIELSPWDADTWNIQDWRRKDMSEERG